MTNVLCPDCGKVFNTSHQLKFHKRNHDQKIYKCDVCEKEVKGKRSLQTHKLSHEYFQCESCNSEVRKSSKTSHKVTCSKKNEDFKCNDCNFTTKFAKNLKIHIISWGLSGEDWL